MKKKETRTKPKDADGTNVLRGDTIIDTTRDGSQIVWEITICHEDGTVTARNMTRIVKTSNDTKRFDPRQCRRDLSARERIVRHLPDRVKKERFAPRDDLDETV